MAHYRRMSLLVVAAATLGANSLGTNLAQADDRSIGRNESIFVDGKSFKITPGKAQGDTTAQIKRLNARELGPGALIFRSGDKLYIVDAPLLLQNAMADGANAYVTAQEMQ